MLQFEVLKDFLGKFNRDHIVFVLALGRLTSHSIRIFNSLDGLKTNADDVLAWQQLKLLDYSLLRELNLGRLVCCAPPWFGPRVFSPWQTVIASRSPAVVDVESQDLFRRPRAFFELRLLFDSCWLEKPERSAAASAWQGPVCPTPRRSTRPAFGA